MGKPQGESPTTVWAWSYLCNNRLFGCSRMWNDYHHNNINSSWPRLYTSGLQHISLPSNQYCLMWQPGTNHDTPTWYQPWHTHLVPNSDTPTCYQTHLLPNLWPTLTHTHSWARPPRSYIYTQRERSLLHCRAENNVRTLVSFYSIKGKGWSNEYLNYN